MGGTKGNKNALGNKGGRPEKWTSSFVAEEIEWMKKYLISSEGENIVFKKELCHLRKYSHSQFTTYVTKFELFEAIKEIDEILEVRIAKAISSGTRLPESTIDLAFKPSSEAAAISSRKSCPIDKWVRLYFSAISLA